MELALIMATYVFGLRALTVTAVAVLSCMGTEWIFQKAMKQDISIFDGSAIITGILFQ